MQGYAFFILIGLYLAKVLACLFLLIDDIRRVIQWVAGRLTGGSLRPRAPAEGYPGRSL
jgi:hypothetical protein